MPGQDRQVNTPLSADLYARLEMISRKENLAKSALVRGAIIKLIEGYDHGA